MMNIEEPLFKYWMFYRYDVNNKIVTKTQLLIQKCKVFVAFLSQMLHICHYLICLYKSKTNEILPDYYFEITQYLSEFKQIVFIVGILAANICIWFIITINTYDYREYKWFEIIHALN